MKKNILFLLLSVMLTYVYSQPTKINFYVAQKLATANNNEQLTLLVKGNIAVITNILEVSGGVLRYSAGDIASVKIPISGIKLMLKNNSIERIEGGPRHIVAMNDTMRVIDNVIEIQNGQAPLPQAYNGEGVVIGIIDSGIDLLHPDFIDSIAGVPHTRVKFLWDQLSNSLTGSTPVQGYGREWDSTEINTGNYAHGDTSRPAGTHGTFVAGVAAGNGTAAGINKGVAPKADLVVVALDFNDQTGLATADAAQYIYTKAQALGKPCVINASVGDYFGSHDGKDLQAQFIDSLLMAQTGRAFVASAGNKGNEFIHLGYNTSSTDTLFSWFRSTGDIYMQLWADTADFKNVQFSIGADRVSPDYLFKGNLPFSTILNDRDVLLEDTLKSGNKRLATILSYKQLVGDAYELEYVITPDSTAFNWRFMTIGDGKFDLWSYDLVHAGIPAASAMPSIVNYVAPDTLQNIVSSFQCSDKVITVGNYQNNKTHIDYNHSLYTNTAVTVGALAKNSGRGPTRDGRIKPDIAASGNGIMSSLVLSQASFYITNYPYALSPGGKHIEGGGTSAASPVVAGIAALYLQRFPTATYADVKNAILNSAKTDAFTGTNLPDNKWGYGKVNGFAALQYCFPNMNLSITGNTVICNGSSTTLNAGGAATNYIWSTGSSAVAITVSPSSTATYTLTGIDANGCISTDTETVLVDFCLGVKDNNNNYEITVYPNPSNTAAFITYNLTAVAAYKTAQVKVYDVIGNLIQAIPVYDKANTVILNEDKYLSGVYICTVEIDGRIMNTQKITIAK